MPTTGKSQECVVCLEALGIHEYAREPLVDAVDWTTKGLDDASEEPETVWFMLGIVNNGVCRGRLVDCHWKYVLPFRRRDCHMQGDR